MTLPRAIVFDMDGVLIDSEVVWRRVREAFAAEHGRHWRAEDQAAVMGVSTDVWSREMVERLALDRDAAALAQEIKARVAASYRAHLPLRPGAVAAVRLAAAHSRAALASGSPQSLIDQVLEASGLRVHFEVVLSGDQVRLGKPHPEIYLRTLEALGVPASAAVGIEDSVHGLQALRAAGMRAIAAPSPEFPLPAEALALTDLHIASMEEIDLALLGRVNSLRPGMSAKSRSCSSPDR